MGGLPLLRAERFAVAVKIALCGSPVFKTLVGA